MTHDRSDYRTLHEAWTRWSPYWREPRPHVGILILDKGHGLGASDYVAAILFFLLAAPLSLANGTYDWFAWGGGVWEQWRP